MKYSVLDLGITDYFECYSLQKQLLNGIKNKQLDEHIIITEHRPVITIGRSGSRKNLLVSEEFLDSRGVEIAEVNRGGNVTYHGPGQIVMYPLIDLKNHFKDVHKYLHNLEDVVIALLAENRIDSFRIKGKTGVWTKKGKIASIGIGLSRWVTFHGVALNVDCDLTPFKWINPCGFKDIKVTSMKKILGTKVDKKHIKNRLIDLFKKIGTGLKNWDRYNFLGEPVSEKIVPVPNFFPPWLKRPLPIKAIEEMNELLKGYNLHTVCQGARCPNIGECFRQKEATFMILGNVCTRNCSFCSVKTGIPHRPDIDEPRRIAKAVRKLGLEYVVITSVTRDDLPDGGASNFASTIMAIRTRGQTIGKGLTPYNIKIEILTPDFNNDISALKIVIAARPDVFGHNIETVPRLYGEVRPHADYKGSISILNYVKNSSDILTKSGIITGLGEKDEEIFEVMKDLQSVGCDILTIGQYLKPSANCLDVRKFIRPEKFQYYEKIAKDLGFHSVVSGPFIRSSYKAKEACEEALFVGVRPLETDPKENNRV